MIGSAAGSYRILEKLGEGGMGMVYRAVDEMVERQVALKMLRSEIANNTELVERFRSEAVALARLNHPAIATLYSFFRQGDSYFMAMEFVPGETLEKKIARDGALPWQQAVQILLRTLEGVSHAHQMGILHRDLKPANIMLTPQAEVKVTDFGIARVLNSARLTREARVVGTLEYLAPERALGKQADARSDLYSLGIVLYEMLTGRLPFEADTDFGLMRAQIEQVPPPPRELGIPLPEPVEAALLKTLEKDPEQRFAHAAGMADAFRDAMKNAGLPPLPALPPLPPVPTPRTGPQRARKPQALVAGAVALGLVALGAGGIGIYQTMQERARRVAAAKAEPVNIPAAPDPGLVPIAPPVAVPVEPFSPPPEVASAPAVPAPAPVEPAAIRRDPPAIARDPGAGNTERILAAIEESGPARSTRPLPWSGIFRALKIDRKLAPPLITLAVERRGVNFDVTADQLIELRNAGAPDVLLKAIMNGHPRPGISAAPPAPAPVSVAAPTSAPAMSPPTPSDPAVNRPPQTVTRLRDVRRLYITGNEGLKLFLRQQIDQELKGRIQFANSAETADAVMQIEVDDDRGNRVVGAAGRVFGLRDKKKATVRIIEPRSKRVLWSAEAGDRQAVAGAFGDAARRIADRIANQLREAWEK